MKRRGFLGLMAGAAVTPLAKALPLPRLPLESGAALREYHDAASLDLAAFDAALKKIYREVELSTFSYSGNPFVTMCGMAAQVDGGLRFPLQSEAEVNRQTEESADGEGIGSEGGESRE